MPTACAICTARPGGPGRAHPGDACSASRLSVVRPRPRMRRQPIRRSCGCCHRPPIPHGYRAMDVWPVILNTLISASSDLRAVELATGVALRVLVAAVLGGLLGFERESHGKAAGSRTHMLGWTGAALFVMGSERVGGGGDAMSRVVQGIVAGIG